MNIKCMIKNRLRHLEKWNILLSTYLFYYKRSIPGSVK